MGLGLGTAFAAGNGAISGPHYNLNILGKTQCSGDDLVGGNAHRIQVLLTGGDVATDLNGKPAAGISRVNKIYLQEGDDFKVLDGNACDKNGALFQLPANPYTCPEDDPNCLNTDPTFQGYLIFARALGKPGGSATITTCATDPGADEEFDTADDIIVCSTENVVLVRKTGRSFFKDVTKELTTLLLDTDGNGKGDTRVGLFDDSLQDYFWNYENRELRLAQLRFYPIAD